MQVNIVARAIQNSAINVGHVANCRRRRIVILEAALIPPRVGRVRPNAGHVGAFARLLIDEEFAFGL